MPLDLFAALRNRLHSSAMRPIPLLANKSMFGAIPGSYFIPAPNGLFWEKILSAIEVNHPLVIHKLGLLRSIDTPTQNFRQLASELAGLLTYEATRSLVLETVPENTWIGQVSVSRLKGPQVTVVPVLRAGMGMLDGVLGLLPGAKVSVVGLYRNEQTLEPVIYYEKLASNIQNRLAIVIDPMLATGGTMVETISILKKAGCRRICCLCLVAAPEGLKRMEAVHPDVDIYTAAIDKKLNDRGYIIPGLGDAGDRLFGTQ